jgi:LysM repeat protein
MSNALHRANIRQCKLMQINRRSFTKNLLIGSLTIPALLSLPQNLFATTYIVKKGDTLSKIAKSQGTTVAKLKRTNQLKTDLIKIGQKIELPKPENYSYRDPLRHIKAQNSKIRVDRNKWEIVVAHHSATKRGNASIFDRAHRKRGMENGLAYHFVIGNGTDTEDGQIEIGPRWFNQLHGGHVRSNYVNQVGIGICLVGNFEEKRPSRAQLKSLVALIDWLKKDVTRKKLKFAGHKDIEKNLCPGKFFPLRALHKKYS